MPRSQTDRLASGETPCVTNDATTTTAVVYAVPNGAAGQLRATVTAMTAGGTVAVYYHSAAIHRPPGGSARVVGAAGGLNLLSPQKDAAAALWGGVSIDASGNDVRVRVTGLLATTISWWWTIEIDLGNAP